MFKNKKVLVTGGTGLVGREAVELLSKRGAKVTSVSLDDNNLNPEWGANYVKKDLRSIDNCMELCEGMDYVFHIAGIKGSPVVMKTFQYQIFRDFIMMNTNMIDAIYSTPSVKWGLYTSTIGIYGPARTFKEDDVWTQNPSPNDWYAGWAKRMGEVQIDAYDEQHGAPKVSIIRPANIYGNFDNFDLRTSTLIPSLTRKVSEAEFTIKEVIETLVKVSGKDLEITHDLTKPTGDQFRVPITDRLEGHGFEVSVKLEDGLRETYEWYSKNGPTKGRFNPYYIGENND